MAEKTTNYNLTKPSAEDFYDINVQNDNMNIIDAELKNLNNNIVSASADAKKAGTDAQSAANNHIANKSNPHNVTASQIGLGNVPNVATNDQTPTYTEASTLVTLASGEKISVAFGKIKKAITNLISHIADTTKHITSTERTKWDMNQWNLLKEIDIDRDYVAASNPLNDTLPMTGVDFSDYTHFRMVFSGDVTITQIAPTSDSSSGTTIYLGFNDDSASMSSQYQAKVEATKYKKDTESTIPVTFENELIYFPSYECAYENGTMISEKYNDWVITHRSQTTGATRGTKVCDISTLCLRLYCSTPSLFHIRIHGIIQIYGMSGVLI